MSLASHLDKLLTTIAKEPILTAALCKKIIAVIDLTLLDKAARLDDLNTVENKALNHEVAAICVYPEQLPKEWPATTKTQRATVVNFPSGNRTVSQCLAEIDIAIQFQADEIDYVFAYDLYQKGQKDEALEGCRTVIDYCRQHGRQTKIILETGAFDTIEGIYQLSKEVIQSGCDFLKSSTGKTAQGASLSAAFAMLAAIKDSKQACGIKLSGGIKTPQQALEYIKLAETMLEKPIDPSWFRIGASSLLDQLLV